MRIYDPRLGRFLSVDPIANRFPMLTPYQFASNRPIDGIDLDGLEFLKGGTAMFKLSNGRVEIKNENVPELFKNEVGKPKFDAMGIRLTPNGKMPAGQIGAGGYNEIPEGPEKFTLDPGEELQDPKTDLWTYEKGYSHFLYSNRIVHAPIAEAPLEMIGTVNDFAGEVVKDVQLKNDTKYWEASGELKDQIAVFDQVVKTVDQYINMENGLKTVDAFNQGQFSRDDLVNFVLDGSLPGGNSYSNIFNSTAILKNMNIMFYGMQIINNNKGRINGRPGPPWNNTIHTVDVSTKTLNTYNQFLDTYKTLNPDSNLDSYKKVAETVKE